MKTGLSETVAGQLMAARPDLMLLHDKTAAIYKIFQSIGVETVAVPERLAITLDHAAPAPTANHARNHAEVREFFKRDGVRHFFEVGRGICRQVLSEEALVLPGQWILSADSHSPHFGWLGAFGAGIGRSAAMLLEHLGQPAAAGVLTRDLGGAANLKTITRTIISSL